MHGGEDLMIYLNVGLLLIFGLLFDFMLMFYDGRKSYPHIPMSLANDRYLLFFISFMYILAYVKRLTDKSDLFDSIQNN